jgi:hypothetical protein
MDVSAVAGSGLAASGTRPMGGTDQLAEARRELRAAAPADSWDAVTAEVSRLQNEQGMSLLAALQEVYARLAAGWRP